MIPRDAVRAWQAKRGLGLSERQADQDLMLRRLMVEVGSHPYLGENTALTGGTTLHQVLLPRPLRYSEDLDLLMRVPSGHGLEGFYKAWRHDIAPRLGLVTNSQAHTEYPKMHLSWKGHAGDGMMITVDLARHPPNVITGERATKRTVSLESEWFSGAADVYCIQPDDLAASKLSACATRIKPRDLFDLYTMREPLGISDGEIVERFLANYIPKGWNRGKGRSVTELHSAKRFLGALDVEKQGGFVPNGFPLSEASRIYADLVEVAADAQEARLAPATRMRAEPALDLLAGGIQPLPAQIPAAKSPDRCEHRGIKSQVQCVEPYGHRGPHRYTMARRRW